jgi:hypothetical protein
MAAIKILKSDTSTGDLTLSDHGNTNARKGEVITWKIGPHSGVDSITAITVKPNSTNVFSSGPAKLGNSSNWQGKIKTEMEIPIDEDYNIYWNDSSGVNHCYDPRISVNN